LRFGIDILTIFTSRAASCARRATEIVETILATLKEFFLKFNFYKFLGFALLTTGEKLNLNVEIPEIFGKNTNNPENTYILLNNSGKYILSSKFRNYKHFGNCLFNKIKYLIFSFSYPMASLAFFGKSFRYKRFSRCRTIRAYSHFSCKFKN